MTGQTAVAAALGESATALRLGLIAPVTPALGGATPGGVATHSEQLARALARLGVTISFLATNAASETGWPRPRTEMGGVQVYRAYVPTRPAAWLNPAYLRTVGLVPALAYALRLAFRGHGGAGVWSRRSWLDKHTTSGPTGRPDHPELVEGRSGRSPLAPIGSRQVALANLLWYRAFIRATRPDVLHVQHPLERHLYARLVREWDGLRLPLVVTLHSFFGEHSPKVIDSLMRPNLAHADALIAVAPHIAEQAVELGADPKRIRVIRSGVDADYFRPRDRSAARARMNLANDTTLVLSVGNVEPRKALDVLLRAMSILRERQVSTLLTLVGSGESAGADDQTLALKALSVELGLQDVVRFEGRVSEARLLDWYAAADIFALPSYSEAQGISALEAMASGLPVVVSAVGGLLGTIHDGETGLFVRPGDASDLAEKLERLTGDPAFRATMGEAARQAVLREFSWRRTAEATLAVYHEVLEAR